MSEIQSLTLRIRELNQSVDWWNTAVIWSLIFVVIAAIAVVVTTRIALVRAKQLTDAQGELIQTKDAQLALDLGDKDLKIADALKAAGEAKERGAVAEQHAAEANLRAEQERLERIKLEEDLSPRLFKAQQEAIERLGAFRGTAVVLEYLLDPEFERTAEQIAFVLNEAGWAITPRPNSDPNPLFREGVIVGGVAEGGVGVVPVLDAKLFGPSAGTALIDELNRTGIDATTSLGFGRGERSVFVHVGVKPSPEQKKIMKHIAEIEKKIVESVSNRRTPDLTDLVEALQKDVRPGTTGGRFILRNQ